MRFDLSGWTSGTLLSAALVLDGDPCYVGEGPWIAVRAVTGGWGAATGWDDRPASGDEIGATTDGSCPRGEARVDVTGAVRDWLSGARPNLGFELRGREPGSEQTFETPDGPVGAERRFDGSGITLELAPVAGPPAPPAPLAPVLLSGVLRDEFDRPVQDGVVAVFPSVEADGAIDSEPLAAAATDASGAFVLRVWPSNPALGVGEDGWTNFDAMFSYGDRVQLRSFSRRIGGGGWGDGESHATIQFDSAAAIAGQAPGVRTAFSQPDHSRPTCNVRTTRLGETDKYVVIGEAHVWKDQSMTWTYGERADSDVGVGYSANGLYWSISGTVHVANRRSVEISDTVSNLGNTQGNFGRRYRSEFHFVKERQTRSCFGRSVTSYRVRATKWNGGFDYYDDVKDLNGHCGDRYASKSFYFEPASGDGRFRRASEDLATYGAAVTVFGAILSNQSGASTSVSQAWRFGQKYDRYYLCGDTAKPDTSDRIFAGF